MSRFKQVMDGEWVKPVMKGYLMKCCGCGLVHKIDFNVIRWGRGHKVEFRATLVKKGKMNMEKLKSKQVTSINREFERLSERLHAFRKVCQNNGNPIRCVTYTVMDNHETKLHVTYGRVKKGK